MKAMALQVVYSSGLGGKPNDKYCSSALLSSRCRRPSNFYSRIRIRKPKFIYGCVASADVGLFDLISSRPRGMTKRGSALKCSSSENNQTEVPESKHIVELPLFPLPLVLFPGAVLPLQIFEFRYRIMMHTLLQTDLRFGVIYSDNSNGTVDVGCVGEVIKHERLVDERFFVICKGQERFRVVNLVRTKPFLVAEVQWLEDRPSVTGKQDLESLASEVETCMKDVIRLSNKLNGKPEKETMDLRRNLFPTPFSFFVGSTFEGAPREQQALLELEDTALRLKREKETLRSTLSYLAAASAVNDAFQYSSNEN